MAIEIKRRWSDVGCVFNRNIQSVTSEPGWKDPNDICEESAFARLFNRNVSVTAHAVEDQECVICLDTLVDCSQAIFTAECGHRFHLACLIENINHDEVNSDKCPICRKPQKEWPEQTKGLVNAHPFCTNCGKRGTGGQFCDGCGHSLAHTPTARERSRVAAASTVARNNLVVECPTCRIRCLVNGNVRGTLQCPNRHLFQVQVTAGNSFTRPASADVPPDFRAARTPQRNSITRIVAHNNYPASVIASSAVMRQCPTCFTQVQMPPGSRAGQYMCPHGHTFYYTP